MKSNLLVLLSVGMVGTWVYHLYDKTIYSQRRTEVYVKDSAAVADGIRDSLQKIYSVTINDLDSRLAETRNDADSVKTQLNSKLTEIYKLKNEISTILKNRGASKADMLLARQKISLLQEKVDELRTQNDNMEAEKRQLNDVLSQLTQEVKGLEENVKRLGEENKVLVEKVNLASVFVASELKLAAITVKNSKEQETLQSKKASKLIVSFTVQNNISENNHAEVYLVLTQPDGQTLKNSVWDSGSFDTQNEGRKNYTLKMRFEYQKGEPKKLLFTLNPEGYQKGQYTMQVYHNGIRIGQTTQTLS